MTEKLDGSSQEPTVSPGVGLLMALLGVGVLFNPSLEELPLRTLTGSVLVLAAGCLLLGRRKEREIKKPRIAPGLRMGNADVLT
mgnify:CR=1 FL=1